MADKSEPAITVSDAPREEDRAVITDGLRAYNDARAGASDARQLIVLVHDPETGKPVGGLFGRSYLGLLTIERFHLPEAMRRHRIGSRVLAMAEEEGRRRGCTRVSLNTLEIQARGFYEKQGYEAAATLDCAPPGVTRFLMTKKL